MKNLHRKADQADKMFDSLVSHMNEALSIQRSSDHDKPIEVPTWAS